MDSPPKLIGCFIDIKQEVFVSCLDADIFFKFKGIPYFKTTDTSATTIMIEIGAPLQLKNWILEPCHKSIADISDFGQLMPAY
jgi:hypothetical protein